MGHSITSLLWQSFCLLMGGKGVKKERIKPPTSSSKYIFILNTQRHAPKGGQTHQIFFQPPLTSVRASLASAQLVLESWNSHIPHCPPNKPLLLEAQSFTPTQHHHVSVPITANCTVSQLLLVPVEFNECCKITADFRCLPSCLLPPLLSMHCG